ncbi:hypothetical protein TWF191_006670 [Orbilia oligospora]|uniref:Uncharacterized protein n=1 Tax=Orbilia oligospora TaxID=2813651 RepID=A0A7C8UNJ4_ORBOL|nr:hypothetical protein TWF191_006670 [Orbilia oligospora]
MLGSSRCPFVVSQSGNWVYKDGSEQHSQTVTPVSKITTSNSYTRAIGTRTEPYILIFNEEIPKTKIENCADATTGLEDTKTEAGEDIEGEESEVRDSDGVLWVKMPFVSPEDIYNFSAEFYIAPPRIVEVNTAVGPPPIIVRLHIVDKKTGQEVPYDNDPERYYWAMARVLHEDHTLCTEPEYQNKNQATETPMSWFHEEQEEDTRTPVTQTPPPGGPVRKWKTFVTFPGIQIPVVGKYRIMITLGVYIDQKLRAADGREKDEKVCKELVSTTSDVIIVQEEEPKDDDASDLLQQKDLYDKFLAERDEFFKREQNESY